MNKYLTLLAYASALILPVTCHPLQSTDAALRTRNILSKREEPTTGDDLPDTEPHPNQLDQVETAFADAILLAQHAHDSIDDDETIFSNYFHEGDRAGVKNVFSAIIGSSSLFGNYDGSHLLGNIHVQTTDTEGSCSDQTLAYTNDGKTEHPYIVLCPNAFKKKAISDLNGADHEKADGAVHYIDCDTLKANGHVSYLMNALGATLIHEYTHYDGLTEHIFGGPIIDQDDGYGPYNVYGRLDKGLSPFNADSYMYYAVHSYFNHECDFEFGAPRDGIDNIDPDCGGMDCDS